MKEEKKESPIGVLWGWGKPYHGKFIGSIILAVLGVACQMVPYFCVAHIVTLMLSGEQDFSSYMTACIVALCGYLGKVVFANLSTVISHTATYYTLRDLRENITAKLAMDKTKTDVNKIAVILFFICDSFLIVIIY